MSSPHAGAIAAGRPDLPAHCAVSSGQSWQTQLASAVESSAAANTFSGIVLVACEGHPIFSAANGKADRATGTPITVNTRFNLGSMNKMWTAIAVAQLIEQGKIDLDAPVGRYLPEISNPTIREDVRVRHLLTHTSGLGSYFGRGFLRDHVSVQRASDYLPFFVDDPPAFTPGSKMLYSNAGFALLGAIIERVSGLSFFEYMQRNVLDRAGMANAAFLQVKEGAADLAHAYGRTPRTGEIGDVTPLLEARGGPAGGAYATASDIVAFSRALWDGRLVGKKWVEEFTAGKVAMGPNMKYAYGFGEGSINGWRHVGHNGGAPGVGTEFLTFPDHGLDIVVLTNVDMPVATDVIMQAARLLTGPREGS
jgi:CubicO group peptidase (beta-lactamase class C family)